MRINRMALAATAAVLAVSGCTQAAAGMAAADEVTTAAPSQSEQDKGSDGQPADETGADDAEDGTDGGGTEGTTQAEDAAEEADGAANRPGFLDAADLPPHGSSDWVAGDIVRGLPEHPTFCTWEALGQGTSWHREYHTEFDTHANQITVRAKSESAATQLESDLAAAVTDCAPDWLRENPGGTASWQYYGPTSGGDSAVVYGVHTSIPDSEPGVHLYGIGRDGRVVTVVQWGQMGNLSDAPVSEFTGTTTTAVENLR